MRNGSLVAGILSLLGAAVAFAVAALSRDLIGMPSGIGVVLLLNAAARFRLAREQDAAPPQR